MAKALKFRLSDMQERMTRLQRRADRKRELVTSTMIEADLKKLTESDFTVSLRSSPPPLQVIEESSIPKKFWRPQPPKLDRKKLIDWLKGGNEIPGAVLGNDGFTIAVRTK